MKYIYKYNLLIFSNLQAYSVKGFYFDLIHIKVLTI